MLGSEIGHKNRKIVQNAVFPTVNFLDGCFLYGDFTVLSVALLEGCLVGGGARGRGTLWGACVLGLIATMFPVQSNTLLHTHTLMIVLPPEVDTDNDAHHNDND